MLLSFISGTTSLCNPVVAETFFLYDSLSLALVCRLFFLHVFQSEGRILKRLNFIGFLLSSNAAEGLFHCPESFEFYNGQIPNTSFKDFQGCHFKEPKILCAQGLGVY